MKDRHVFEVELRASPERVWRAIVDGEITRTYFFGTRVESTFEPGAPIGYVEDDGTLALEGTIVEVDPPRRLVATFVMTHHDEGRKEAPSRVTWSLEPRGDGCALRLVHDELEPGGVVSREVKWGWEKILNGLKTTLEAR